MKKLTILSAMFFIFIISGNVYASGVTYSVKQIGENTVTITLNAELQQGQGVEVTSASKKDGKVLNIFYRVGKDISGMNSIDVDLRTMLPPIRIILTNIDKPDELIFSDIKGIYAEEFIRHLHDMGAIGGYPDGTFKPTKNVTRAEFVTMLLNSLKVEKKSKSKGFKDTQKHWAKDAINTACDMKIVTGFSDGTFKPDQNVTAAEAATIIGKLFNFSTLVQTQMPKLNQKHWAYDSVKKIISAGIISSEDKLFKDFSEDTYLNRADCAMLVSRAITTK